MLFQKLRKVGTNDEALGREVDGRLDKVFPRECPLLFPGPVEALDGPGNHNGLGTDLGDFGQKVPLIVKEDLFSEESRGNLPKVEKERLFPHHLSHHEASTPKVSRLRVGDGQGEAYGDGCVYGVSTLLENGLADLCGQGFVGGDRRSLCPQGQKKEEEEFKGK